jgi:serine/threonine protein kinase
MVVLGSILFGDYQSTLPFVTEETPQPTEIIVDPKIISFGDFEDEFAFPNLHFFPGSRIALEKKGITIPMIQKIHHHFASMQSVSPISLDGKNFVLTKDHKYVVLCFLHDGTYKREKLDLRISELQEGTIHLLARGTAMVGEKKCPGKKRDSMPALEANIEATVYHIFKQGYGRGIVQSEECSIIPYQGDVDLKKMILVQEYYPQTLIEFDRENHGKAEARFLSIMRSVLQGLKTLEETGITVRDIKSDNIYIKDEKGYIADFTLAIPWQKTRGLFPFPEDAYSNLRNFHLALGHEPPEFAKNCSSEWPLNVLQSHMKTDVWMAGVTLLRPFFPYLFKEHSAEEFHVMVDQCFFLHYFSVPSNQKTGKRGNLWQSIQENVKKMNMDFPRPPENTYSFLLWNMLRFLPEDRMSPSDLVQLEQKISEARNTI